MIYRPGMAYEPPSANNYVMAFVDGTPLSSLPDILIHKDCVLCIQIFICSIKRAPIWLSRAGYSICLIFLFHRAMAVSAPFLRSPESKAANISSIWASMAGMRAASRLSWPLASDQ